MLGEMKNAKRKFWFQGDLQPMGYDKHFFGKGGGFEKMVVADSKVVVLRYGSSVLLWAKIVLFDNLVPND